MFSWAVRFLWFPRFCVFLWSILSMVSVGSKFLTVSMASMVSMVSMSFYERAMLSLFLFAIF